MIQQNTANKKKGPPKFQHLPKARGRPRTSPALEEFSRTGSFSETAQIRMGANAQSQVQVESRKTQGGDPISGKTPRCAGTRCSSVEHSRHIRARIGSSASTHRCPPWNQRTTFQIRGTSGKSPKFTGDQRIHSYDKNGSG